jgi:hypothetical protein
MKKTIKLTERDLTRLVRRIIREQGEEGTQSPSTDLPLCSSLMNSDPNMPGSGSNLNGPFDKITSNGSVAPQYQGLTVHQNNKPYCFIPNS